MKFVNLLTCTRCTCHKCLRKQSLEAGTFARYVNSEPQTLWAWIWERLGGFRVQGLGFLVWGFEVMRGEKNKRRGMRAVCPFQVLRSAGWQKQRQIVWTLVVFLRCFFLAAKLCIQQSLFPKSPCYPGKAIPWILNPLLTNFLLTPAQRGIHCIFSFHQHTKGTPLNTDPSTLNPTNYIIFPGRCTGPVTGGTTRQALGLCGLNVHCSNSTQSNPCTQNKWFVPTCWYLYLF